MAFDHPQDTVGGIEQLEVSKRPILPFIEGSNDFHVISADQFVPERLPDLFDRADELHELDAHDDTQTELKGLHYGRRIAVTFHEPSTRTDFSFRTGAGAMGIQVDHTNNAGSYSSAAKGETIEDTARTMDQYGYRAVVIRHGESGSLARAARASQTPIINAGDGPGEHPTQALLDAYTIYRQHGSLEDRHIVFGGDLRYGRTVHSLTRLLAKYSGTTITFASIPELSIPDSLKTILDKSGTPFRETHDVYDALRDPSTDVVYWTRTQKERMQPEKGKLSRRAKILGDRALEFARQRGILPELEPQAGFVLDPNTIEYLASKAKIMHPLPRVDEIDEAIDDDPRAIYFEQVKNGLYARMALIDWIVDNTRRP